ncbi:MAG: sulfite exporter TauE/SafE family protein [Thermomicrobiales bacterium]
MAGGRSEPDRSGGAALTTIATLALTTFALGVVLGFIGAGGAGLVVALLTSLFRLPIHEAIGTALAAMCFVTVAGAASHYREGNVSPRVGVTAGVSGVIGAILGASFGQNVSAALLKPAAGLALWALAAMVWPRTRVTARVMAAHDPAAAVPVERQTATAIGLGLSGGAASAFFGVGMAPYLQLGFLTALKLPLRQTIGTTMLTLVFISVSGASVLATTGAVSVPHLVGTVAGLSAGSFVGARFTRRAPRRVLRGSVVAAPVIAGAMLLFV